MVSVGEVKLLGGEGVGCSGVGGCEFVWAGGLRFVGGEGSDSGRAEGLVVRGVGGLECWCGGL